MKIDNFRDLQSVRNQNKQYFTALIDVEEGFLWWKKTRTEKIIRQQFGCWFFADSGKFPETMKVENMEDSYRVNLAAAKIVE